MKNNSKVMEIIERNQIKGMSKITNFITFILLMLFIDRMYHTAGQVIEFIRNIAGGLIF